MVLAVDFDGTLVENKFPEIGKPNMELVNKIKLLQNEGAELILWTCRNGDSLKEAIDFCRNTLELNFDYINSNTRAQLEMYGWNDSRKVGADYYIDDRAITIDEFLKLP